MAKITAQGKTWLGKAQVEITGNGTIQSIECNNDDFKMVLEDAIKNGDGWMANNYHPFPETMLQAYAYLTNVFGYDAVHVVGDIGTIPMAEQGKIY